MTHLRLLLPEIIFGVVVVCGVKIGLDWLEERNERLEEQLRREEMNQLIKEREDVLNHILKEIKDKY